MNWEAISAISEAIGILVVVASLVYVAKQINQNTISVKANAHQTWVATVIAEQSAGLQESTSKTIAIGLRDPSSLTAENWVQFANYCNLFLLKAESAYFLQKNGILDNAVSGKELDRAVKFLLSTGPTQWWAAGARTQFTDEFVTMIEARLSQPTGFQVYDFTPGEGFHPLADTGLESEQ